MANKLYLCLAFKFDFLPSNMYGFNFTFSSIVNFTCVHGMGCVHLLHRFKWIQILSFYFCKETPSVYSCVRAEMIVKSTAFGSAPALYMTTKENKQERNFSCRRTIGWGCRKRQSMGACKTDVLLKVNHH